MGISIGFSEDYIKKKRNPGTPDPESFQILDAINFNDMYCLIKVKYSYCINYDGIKILVIEYNGNLSDLKVLDPHFLEPKDYSGPRVIARFEPTNLGWQLGLDCLDTLCS